VLEHERHSARRGRALRAAAQDEQDSEQRERTSPDHGACSNRGSSSPKIVAPSRNASGNVAAEPDARLSVHHSATCSSDRKKLSVCQRAVHALPRRSPRSPIQAITPGLFSGPVGVIASSIGSAQW